MKKIFITGSTDGIGFMAAERLIEKGHQVLLHARNAQKAEAVRQKLPKTLGVVTGDLASIDETKDLANAVNDYGDFDSIIHNAAVGYQERYEETRDGLPHVFQVNSLALPADLPDQEARAAGLYLFRDEPAGVCKPG